MPVIEYFPFRFAEELVLKIPWRDFFASPTVVHIKGLYLLAVPNDAVSYDEKKEAEALKEAKKRILERIEEAKMIEAAGGNDQNACRLKTN